MKRCKLRPTGRHLPSIWLRIKGKFFTLSQYLLGLFGVNLDVEYTSYAHQVVDNLKRQMLTLSYNIDPKKVEKTKALLLYICDKMKDEGTFGSVVLNKVLYFADHLWYQKHGEVISGFKYVKQRNGPTPMPNQFLALRDSLIQSNQLSLEEREYFGRIQKVCKAKIKPDLALFSNDEISFIDGIIDEFRGTNANFASNMSHELLAWKIAKPMQELPYFTFLLSEGELTQDDLDWAKKAIRERNAA